MTPHQELRTTPQHGKPGAPVCEGCMNWERFGKNCWVYWDEKKVCTQFIDATGKSPSGYRRVEHLRLPFEL
ncbi:hypothetical protein HYS47_02910 [Candidatus Woesearchaeota archaeon]|nr:hypothetical protein [Candidatus Woesearchaeota archaeon]